jgi:GNAT superfamily N-acetyltransferase
MVTTELVLRDVRADDDLDAINAGCPVWFSGDLLRQMFAVEDGTPKLMVVAERAGEVVGYAHAVGHGVTDGRRGLGYVFVRPEHRRTGVGTALWSKVLEVCTPERVPGVSVQVDESDGSTLAVAAARGFVPRGLHVESRLDLAGIGDLSPLATAPRAPGVVLRPLPEDVTEEGWHRFKEVYDRLMADAPDVADGAEVIPYDVLRAVLHEPWQVTGAWVGGELVGFTAIAVLDPVAGKLNTWFTGVDKEHRGLGLSTALKAAQALALKEAGWSSILTQNMEGNAAILASNRTLGFRPVLGKRDLTLDF